MYDGGVYIHSLVARKFFCCTVCLRTSAHLYACHTRMAQVSVKRCLHVCRFSPSRLLPSLVSHHHVLSPYDSLSRLSRPHVLAVLTCPKSAGHAHLRTRTRSVAIWPRPPSTHFFLVQTFDVLHTLRTHSFFPLTTGALVNILTCTFLYRYNCSTAHTARRILHIQTAVHPSKTAQTCYNSAFEMESGLTQNGYGPDAWITHVQNLFTFLCRDLWCWHVVSLSLLDPLGELSLVLRHGRVHKYSFHLVLHVLAEAPPWPPVLSPASSRRRP